MTKLTDQFPRAGLECTFYLKDGQSFIGFYDHGGAYDKSKITGIKGNNYYFEQGAKDDNDFTNILSWEYLKR